MNIEKHLSEFKENGAEFAAGMQAFEMQLFIGTFWNIWAKISPIVWVMFGVAKRVIFWKKAYWAILEVGLTELDELVKIKTRNK